MKPIKNILRDMISHNDIYCPKCGDNNIYYEDIETPTKLSTGRIIQIPHKRITCRTCGYKKLID
jgi:predicted nucleic-acid-binding Zn-ribbon protein